MPGARSGADYRSTLRFARPTATATAVDGRCALEPYDGSRFPWGTWYHERAPAGEFKKVPGSYMRLGMNERLPRP